MSVNRAAAVWFWQVWQSCRGWPNHHMANCVVGPGLCFPVLIDWSLAAGGPPSWSVCMDHGVVVIWFWQIGQVSRMTHGHRANCVLRPDCCFLVLLGRPASQKILINYFRAVTQRSAEFLLLKKNNCHFFCCYIINLYDIATWRIF